MNRNYLLVILSLIIFSLFFVFEANNLNSTIEGLKQQRAHEVQELENTIYKLEEGYREYEEKLYGVGGAADYPTTEEFSDFIFPIAEEDFIRYTSPFGLREDPFFEVDMHHRGVDIATVWRAQVVSVADGVVVQHYPPPGTRQGNTTFQGHRVYGGMIRIEHEDFETLYAHLSETNVRTGDEVEAGQVIGRVGDTGMSRGQHLHLEMFINDRNVNPLLYLSELDY